MARSWAWPVATRSSRLTRSTRSSPKPKGAQFCKAAQRLSSGNLQRDKSMWNTHHGCATSNGSRLTTIGSCELRTITHCEGVSGDGLISWCGAKGVHSCFLLVAAHLLPPAFSLPEQQEPGQQPARSWRCPARLSLCLWLPYAVGLMF
jgi:hypothetical protein